MSDDEFNSIITAVAKEHNVSIDYVIQEMQDAIIDLFSRPPITPEAKRYLDSIKRKGDVPTVREFIEYMAVVQSNGFYPLSGPLN